MADQKIPSPTPSKIRTLVRLLVFDIGTLKLGTPVEYVRTIIDLEEQIEYFSGGSTINNFSTGNTNINVIDIAKLYFPEQKKVISDEKKLIVMKSSGKALNGILVDHIYGVASFQEVYPIPEGIIEAGDHIITHLVLSENPWLQVVNLEKIAEINSFTETEAVND